MQFLKDQLPTKFKEIAKLLLWKIDSFTERKLNKPALNGIATSQHFPK